MLTVWQTGHRTGPVLPCAPARFLMPYFGSPDRPRRPLLSTDHPASASRPSSSRPGARRGTSHKRSARTQQHADAPRRRRCCTCRSRQPGVRPATREILSQPGCCSLVGGCGLPGLPQPALLPGRVKKRAHVPPVRQRHVLSCLSVPLPPARPCRAHRCPGAPPGPGPAPAPRPTAAANASWAHRPE